MSCGFVNTVFCTILSSFKTLHLKLICLETLLQGMGHTPWRLRQEDCKSELTLDILMTSVWPCLKVIKINLKWEEIILDIPDNCAMVMPLGLKLFFYLKRFHQQLKFHKTVIEVKGFNTQNPLFWHFCHISNFCRSPHCWQDYKLWEQDLQFPNTLTQS